jgi:CheY-like chemotaxis protein
MHMTKLQQPHTSATNGREAIDAYKASPADIVFMDLHMPVMDGLEASREIRRYEHEMGLVPTAIVALTGAASLHARQEAFSSGMDLFLTKPVAMKLLKEVLLVFRDKGREALRDFG